MNIYWHRKDHFNHILFCGFQVRALGLLALLVAVSCGYLDPASTLSEVDLCVSNVLQHCDLPRLTYLFEALEALSIALNNLCFQDLLFQNSDTIAFSVEILSTEVQINFGVQCRLLILASQLSRFSRRCVGGIVQRFFCADAGPENWRFCALCERVRRIFSLFYAKIMVFGDGQFYRGFGGYWVVGFLGCEYSCSCQFGTDLALVE